MHKLRVSMNMFCEGVSFCLAVKVQKHVCRLGGEAVDIHV